MDFLVSFVGRLHPLLVHFPIALLLVGAAVRVYALASKRPEVSLAARVLVVVGAVSAVAASVAGLALSSTDDWNGAALERLQLHRALGLLAATMAVAAAALERRLSDTLRFRAELIPLFLCAVFVAAAGHVGGLLVFGEDHFSSVLDDDASPDGAPSGEQTRALTLYARVSEAPIDFREEVLPILERSCFRCHGERKQKGGLRLHDRAAAMNGGETGPAIVPGDPLSSLLYRAITLPEGDSDFMPRKGDALTISERQLLGRWIEEGARWDD